MREELTDRQKAILDFISEATRSKGYPPSIREISAHFGIQSTQGVLRHIDALEKKGFLKRDSRSARALQVTHKEAPEEPLNVRMVPLLGTVAAGVPITAVENVEDQLPIASDWLSLSKDYFLLRVRGDSMAEAIQPGDLVLVERQGQPERGQIVVAMVDDEATVKRYHPEKGKVILRSDNPVYDDIVVTGNLEILGRVTALIRKYR